MAHTQSYNIEFFSSHKPIKASVWFELPAFFPNFREKILTGIFLLANREKGRERIFGTTTESSSLGSIGADFARQKVLLYEIADEEVIYKSPRICKGQRNRLFSETMVQSPPLISRAISRLNIWSVSNP